MSETLFEHTNPESITRVKELEVSSALPKGATAALLAPGVKPQREDAVLVN